MKLEDLFFELPEELIAEKPKEKREESRLLVLDRTRKIYYEKKFSNILEYFDKNSLIVFNNTKVFKARLKGKTEKREIELLLIEKISPTKWKAMVKNSRKFKAGEIAFFNNEKAIIKEKDEEYRIIEFEKEMNYDDINKIGLTPLPPYIISKRKKMGLSEYDREDDRRYQSVLAKYYGSVAAPTASFHFSEELLSRLKEKGVEFAFVTLHIGPGTFKPIEGNIEEFKIHKEWFSIDEENAKKIKKAKKDGRIITAVGTTVVRSLESLGTIFGTIENIKPYANYTDLFIKEGFNFKIVDRLITNFHLPYSTLLLLIFAFAGKDFVKEAYKYAIENKFRFFSYGDAMFII